MGRSRDYGRGRHGIYGLGQFFRRVHEFCGDCDLVVALEFELKFVAVLVVRLALHEFGALADGLDKPHNALVLVVADFREPAKCVSQEFVQGRQVVIETADEFADFGGVVLDERECYVVMNFCHRSSLYPRG